MQPKRGRRIKKRKKTRPSKAEGNRRELPQGGVSNIIFYFYSPRTFSSYSAFTCLVSYIRLDILPAPRLLSFPETLPASTNLPLSTNLLPQITQDRGDQVDRRTHSRSLSRIQSLASIILSARPTNKHPFTASHPPYVDGFSQSLVLHIANCIPHGSPEAKGQG